MDMTFEQFLTEQEEPFDGDVTTTSGFEPEASLTWDPRAIALTYDAEDDFAGILALPCELRSADLLVLDTSASDEDESDLEALINEFVCAVAGFIPEDDYARWFEEA